MVSHDVGYQTFIAEIGNDVWLMLVDTACAKTVAGMYWAKAAQRYLMDKFAYEGEFVDDDESFRFGPGPVVRSKKALLLPLEMNGRGAMVRVSLVEVDIPPYYRERR